MLISEVQAKWVAGIIREEAARFGLTTLNSRCTFGNRTIGVAHYEDRVESVTYAAVTITDDKWVWARRLDVEDPNEFQLIKSIINDCIKNGDLFKEHFERRYKND